MTTTPLLNFDQMPHTAFALERDEYFSRMTTGLTATPRKSSSPLETGEYMHLMANSGGSGSGSGAGGGIATTPEFNLSNPAESNYTKTMTAAANASQISSSSEYLTSSNSSPNTQNASSSFNDTSALNTSKWPEGQRYSMNMPQSFMDAFVGNFANSMQSMSSSSEERETTAALTLLESATKTHLRQSVGEKPTSNQSSLSTESGKCSLPSPAGDRSLSFGPHGSHPQFSPPNLTVHSGVRGGPPVSSAYCGGPRGLPPFHPGGHHPYMAGPPHPHHPYLHPGYPIGLDPARRKNATRENTATLKAWLQEHIKNPYPTKGEKIMLAIITKMTLTQVSTWFANARRRLKKENKMTWSPKVNSGAASSSEDAGRPARCNEDDLASRKADEDDEEEVDEDGGEDEEDRDADSSESCSETPEPSGNPNSRANYNSFSSAYATAFYPPPPPPPNALQPVWTGEQTGSAQSPYAGAYPGAGPDANLSFNSMAAMAAISEHYSRHNDFYSNSSGNGAAPDFLFDASAGDRFA